jgi:hypothetical protein
MGSHDGLRYGQPYIQSDLKQADRPFGQNLPYNILITLVVQHAVRVGERQVTCRNLQELLGLLPPAG